VATVPDSITGPASSVDRGIVLWDGTSGSVVLDSGVRHYGAAGSSPALPAPADGDLYYSTALDLLMVYDLARGKWLSVSTSTVAFGRNGNTGGGAFYRGPGSRAYSATQGRPAEHDGTVVALTYTRIDVDAATFEVTEGGSSIATLASAATSGTDFALDGDFSAGGVLGVKNQVGSNTTRHVTGWVTLRWRT